MAGFYPNTAAHALLTVIPAEAGIQVRASARGVEGVAWLVMPSAAEASPVMLSGAQPRRLLSCRAQPRCLLSC